MGRVCRLTQSLWLAFLIGLVLLGTTAQGTAAELVVVEVASGRVFSGHFDSRTSRQVLVLRIGAYDMMIVRPLDWNTLVRVNIDGQNFTPEELLKQFDAQGWPNRIDEPPAPPRPALVTVRPPGPLEVFSESPSPAVRSLHIEASAAKWTSGAANDGLLLRVFPLDAEGQIVPVHGTLEVDLIGQQSAARTQGEPFPQLARWGQQVSPQDVGQNGATYRLPFQAWHPDFDLQLGSSGVVHARLSVPGQGVFDDTATMVRVRPYDASRDRLQQFSGSRFFPQEQTQRGTNDSGRSQP